MNQKGNFNDLFGLDSSLIAISHELKSPLALIRQLSLFLEETDQPDKKLINQITLTSERALRLANDLSKAARINQLEFDLEPVSPVEVCHKVAADLAAYYQIYGNKIKIKGAKRNNYLAVANYDLLRSILIHFCDNALAYADQKPIELEVNKLKKQNTIRISVRDFGPRLPLEVWRSFKKRTAWQPQKISSRPTSSGLGLFLAHRFADAMNAQVGAISHSDGVTFYVDLELSKQLTIL